MCVCACRIEHGNLVAVSLHPIQRRQAEQPHGTRQDVPGAQEQVHPGHCELLLLVLYLEGLPGG